MTPVFVDVEQRRSRRYEPTFEAPEMRLDAYVRADRAALTRHEEQGSSCSLRWDIFSAIGGPRITDDAFPTRSALGRLGRGMASDVRRNRAVVVGRWRAFWRR